MREIKFRAWNGIAVVPVVSFDAARNPAYYFKPLMGWSDTRKNTPEVGQAVNRDDYDFVLMQNTGLRDKNGKEIYEGDILSVWLGNGKTRKQHFHEVIWDNECAEFRLPAPLKAFEVIGNIYENPELLTDGVFKKYKNNDSVWLELLAKIESAILSNFVSKDKVREALKDCKPDTYLLGCRAHWSDDMKAPCTCDENAATARSFYWKAKKDLRSKLGIEG